MGTNRPLVTVVIPTYNRVHLLLQAVASVLKQTFSNWELIIADDGSTDLTIPSIHALNDPRIHLLELPHTGNIAWLRNMGAQAGKGEWIAFLDSDDLWKSDKLEIQFNLLSKTKKRWAYGRFEHIDESLSTIAAKAGTYEPLEGWIAKQVISTEASVTIGSLIVERELFNEIGGFNTDNSLVYREDYDLALRLALKAEAAASPELLVFVREHAARSTNAIYNGHERTAESLQRFVQMQPATELKKAARKRRAYHLAEAATNNIAKGNYMPAAKQLGIALVNGDKLKHLLSAVNKGFNIARSTRPGNIHHSA